MAKIRVIRPETGQRDEWTLKTWELLGSNTFGWQRELEPPKEVQQHIEQSPAVAPPPAKPRKQRKK